MQTGRVYLVGAGPGDPGLLTVKGAAVLRCADIVVYDHLVSPRLLKACRPSTKRVYVGKAADRHTATQAMINRLLIRAARAGKSVVRLKGGDPFLFGRGGEEALALRRANVPYDIVPGVTSAIAVPAYAGIPVTHRQVSSSVAIVTGHEDPSKGTSAIQWERLAMSCETLVFMMAVSRLPAIATRLIRSGRAATTPCAVIEWGTYPRQRTVTAPLKTIAAAARRASIKAPAILVVGHVVSLRRQLRWFERRPLFGTRLLVTRASEKAGDLVTRLEALGAEVEQLPAIELAPVKLSAAFRDAVTALPQTHWVFFTSPEGIGWFRHMLKPLRKDLRCLAGCHIGAIGPKTAETIEQLGLHVDFVPRQFRQEGVLQELPQRMLRGTRAAIFCAAGSRDVLAEGLRAKGMTVAKVSIYHTRSPKTMIRDVRALFRRPFTYVTVTSASCVDHLAQALRAAGQAAQFRRVRFASIGPITSAAVRARGGRVAIEARMSTIDGLVDALRRRGVR
ncbi:MAG: uroporphyrinogen-III C-methyltransferase [Candidatus Omnitrophica bacterium]|nr:uroporphyrinogen-III C-methyltransferase [Candidatus Omnitrophota bacterium]